MSDFVDKTRVLRNFEKFLCDERHKIDAEYVTKIKPLLSNIKFEDYNYDQLHELVEAIDHVLKYFEIRTGIDAIENDLHKALAELQSMKHDALKRKHELEAPKPNPRVEGLRDSMIRQETGRKPDSGNRNIPPQPSILH